jgi:glycosyltransferase involved in cell wall biosynthesis
LTGGIVKNGNPYMPHKILFITYTHSNGGGAENVLTNLANNLNTAVYKIDIIEINQFLIKQEPLIPEVTLLPPFIKAGHKWTNDAVYYILYNKPEIIKSLFNLYNYDIIVTWNYQLPSFCLRAFSSEIKIAWSHGAISDLSSNKEPDKTFRQLQYLAWEQADKIVTISNMSLQTIKDVFPDFNDKTDIIYNGCDIKRIQRFALEKCMKPLPDYFDDNIILCIGRLDENKNFELVIRATSKLIHSGAACFLVIVGQGELQERLENIAKEENIQGSVFFAGYQQNPYPYFSKAKICCFSSFCEGFPMVTIEAMSLGKPFVTTPVAGASEELADNGSCGLVSGWNIDEYSECIKKLLTDRELYEKMAFNCIEKAEGFSIEKSASKFDALVNELLSENQERIIKKQANKKTERIKAVLIFAIAFGVRRNTGLLEAIGRFKNKFNLINAIKLIYRFIFFICKFLLIPFIFMIGFIKGIQCDRY